MGDANDDITEEEFNEKLMKAAIYWGKKPRKVNENLKDDLKNLKSVNDDSKSGKLISDLPNFEGNLKKKNFDKCLEIYETNQSYYLGKILSFEKRKQILRKNIESAKLKLKECKVSAEQYEISTKDHFDNPIKLEPLNDSDVPDCIKRIEKFSRPAPIEGVFLEFDDSGLNEKTAAEISQMFKDNEINEIQAEIEDLKMQIISDYSKINNINKNLNTVYDQINTVEEWFILIIPPMPKNRFDLDNWYENEEYKIKKGYTKYCDPELVQYIRKIPEETMKKVNKNFKRLVKPDTTNLYKIITVDDGIEG